MSPDVFLVYVDTGESDLSTAVIQVGVLAIRRGGPLTSQPSRADTSLAIG